MDQENRSARVRGHTASQLTNKASSRRRPASRVVAGFFGLLAAAASAGAARASDLTPTAAPPVFQPPPPPQFSWTGFYIGVNVGGGLDHFAFPFSITAPSGGSIVGTSGITSAGPVGGIQVGFNYELPFFHIVAGIEIDNDPTGIRGDSAINGVLSSGAPITATFGTRFIDFGTARLRLGYAWGRFLPYLAGGFTYGTAEASYSVSTPGFFSTGGITETRSGVIPHVATIGAGIEYAIAPNFTIKAEYLYDFINARQVAFNPAPGATISFNTRTAYHIGRVGVNYKFDWFSPPAAPVVAKY
jgi:outer membrane immunogenic protein